MTVELGHHHVEQDQVRLLGQGQLQGLGATGGHQRLAILAKEFVEDADIQRLVVDDQQFGFAAPSGGLGGRRSHRASFRSGRVVSAAAKSRVSTWARKRS